MDGASGSLNCSQRAVRQQRNIITGLKTTLKIYQAFGKQIFKFNNITQIIIIFYYKGLK